MAAVRDPLLRATDPPTVTLGHRRGSKGARIGPGLGLGERECADHTTGRELRHEPLPLLLGAESEDGERRRARVHRNGDTDTGVGA